MKNIKISVKLIIYLAGIGVVTTLIVGVFAFVSAKESLIERTKEQLTSIREIKKSQIETFFNERVGDVKVLADNPATKQAFKELYKATDFAGGNREKFLMNKPQYKKAYAKFNDSFQYFMETYGYYDVFFINIDDGYVFYTVAIENDFGTVLQKESTHLSKLWKDCKAKNKEVLSDMEKYAPSNDAPAMFVASPIIEDGKTIGILALQISNDAINGIMQQKAGLGESGETYLVGGDMLMRSDSRFSLESTVLKQKIETDGVKKVLSGLSGVEIIDDYRGVPVLSSFNKVNISGLNWGLLAEIDQDEIMKPVHNLRNMIVLIGVFVVSFIVVLAIFIARSFSIPIKKAVDVSENIAKGIFNVNIDVYQKDEIGQLADALRNMVDNLKESVEIAKKVSIGDIKKSQELVEKRSDGELDSALKEMVVNLGESIKLAQIVSEGKITKAFEISELNKSEGDLDLALKDMVKNLRESIELAKTVSLGKLTEASKITEVNKTDGELDIALSEMVENLLKSAKLAKVVSEGNLTNAYKLVESRKTQGELDVALKEMVMNLRKSVELAKIVAGGDLTQIIDSNGELDVALMEMVKNLSKIVENIIESAQNIATASEQMSSSTQQMSQGASEQAASAEEVTSSIEEMSSSIQQNTDNAQQTEKISLKAAEGVLNVAKASNESLISIKNISDKISIINDIAFQTNILALNAAVEAARAGEHGKGFAVVAAEVRKLAERSKIAASEIEILSKSSVKVTEDTKNQMEQLAPEIDKTSKLVQEISAASLEQNSGTNQINSAVQQLSLVIQQNSSASEEMAASAEQLSAQSENLREMVTFFKINETQGRLKKSDSKKSLKQKEVVKTAFKQNDEDYGGVNINLTDEGHFESF